MKLFAAIVKEYIINKRKREEQIKRRGLKPMNTLLTKENLKTLYKALIKLPPFDQLQMPEAHRVEFKVIRDPAVYGLFEPDPNTISVSSGRCSHFDTIIKTLIHEMVHLYCYHTKEDNYEEHRNAKFKRVIKQVATLYGFDPKEL